MSNRTYICTACRTAKRAEAAFWQATPYRCHLCRGPLWELSRRWRIPAKGNDKEWQELARMVAAEAPLREKCLLDRAQAKLKAIDSRITTLSSQKQQKGQRSAMLSRLRTERAQLIAQHFPEQAPP